MCGMPVLIRRYAAMIALSFVAHASALADDAPARILSPTLGRPIFVEPGGLCEMMCSGPVSSGGAAALLRRSTDRELTLELTPATQADRGDQNVLAFTTPREALEGVYDLELTDGDTTFTSPHSVAIRKDRGALRVVHLSNMNIGDALAPMPPFALVDEVNLVGPDLIVATGDYLDATHPSPEEGWTRLVEFFRRFDAPLLLACGDHDDLRYYGEWVAPSPIGVTRIGRWQFLTLYDHPSAPITQDSDQVRWVESVLSHEGADLRFMVSHDDFPGLLAYWRDQGNLAKWIDSGRIGAWFTGGHNDWNGREYAAIFKAAGPMLYVRTAQSSPALREGSSGKTRYRWIDITGQHVNFPNGDGAESLPPSIESGGLRLIRHEPEGGVARFTVQNFHPFPIRDLALKARLPVSTTPLWTVGARIAQEATVGDYRLVTLHCDAPARGAVGVQVGSGDAPAERAVQVRFDAPQRITFCREQSASAVEFHRAALTSPVTVQIRNDGQATVDTAIMARLNGDLLGLVATDRQEPSATRVGAHLAPGESLALRLDLGAVIVNSGAQELQLLVGDPRWPQVFVWPFNAALAD